MSKKGNIGQITGVEMLLDILTRITGFIKQFLQLPYRSYYKNGLVDTANHTSLVLMEKVQ